MLLLLNDTQISGRVLCTYAQVDFGTALSTNLTPSSADFARWKRDKAITEESEEFKIKRWFYNHPQYCHNIGDTLSEKANQQQTLNKITTNLPTTCEKFVNISIFLYSWGAIEKPSA